MTTSIDAYHGHAQLALAAYALDLTRTMSRENYEAALRQVGMSVNRPGFSGELRV